MTYPQHLCYDDTKMKNPTHQRGQTLLIVVLVLAVALTIGLAVVSRSVTDIRISRQEEESARVFSAAEAGIEEALKRTDLASGGSISGFVGDINYQVGVTSLSAGQEFVFPEKIEANDVQTVWLIDHNNDGSLNLTGIPGTYYSQSQIEVYWGDENTASNQATTPALEVSLYYKDGSNYKVKRYALDPNSIRAVEKGFESANIGAYSLGGKILRFYKNIDTLPVNIIPYFLRLRLLYNTTAHLLGVKFSGNYYPVQGKCYESTAVLRDSGTTTTTQECLFYKAPPGIFDYVLFSGGDLIHQQ